MRIHTFNQQKPNFYETDPSENKGVGGKHFGVQNCE